MKIIILFLAMLLSFTTYAQQPGQPIHIKVTGKGKPVMFIPGFTVPGESWEPVVNALANKYECHVVTLAGFGGKEPIDFPWLPKVNQALYNYIKELKRDSITVVGHSLGGTVALWLGSRDLSKIASIIIIDALPAAGALMFPNFNPDDLAYDSPFNNQQLAMSDVQFEQMAKGMAQGMSLNPATQEKIKEWITSADRKTYVYGYTDYLKLDVREALKSISVPVTILAADKPFGREIVSSTYKTQYNNLSRYDIIIADNAAHFVMFDQPQWFMEQIQKLLSLH